MISLEELTARVAALSGPATIRVTSSDRQQSDVLATIDMLEMLAAESSLRIVHCPDEAMVGVRVTLAVESNVSPISFWGTPSGYELEGLVYALECLTQPNRATDSIEGPHIVAILNDLPRPVCADLFVTPT